jgi:hypothetical protein
MGEKYPILRPNEIISALAKELFIHRNTFLTASK